MGEFQRNRLPDPISYYESRGLTLMGKGKWRTTSCSFHGGSDSMRINTGEGGWVCMSCGVKGGDILAYEMQVTGTEFPEVCKALGAWVGDDHISIQYKACPLTPRQALTVLAFESTLVAVAAGNAANGVALTDTDISRLFTAAGRINKIAEAFQ
jgi:hypothetical protein